MSTPTLEKAPASLGSFLGKLAPKPTDKPVEKAAEVPTQTAEVKSDPPSTDQSPAKIVAPAKADQPVKSDVAPKEATPDPDALRKQLSDQAKANLRLGQENADLKRTLESLRMQNERIEKKLDGTYEDPPPLSTDAIVADADIKGRIRASHHAAVRQYGKEFVMQTVWNADSPYQELQAADPRLRARVMEADDPVLEAIAVVKEQQDGEKYGRTPEEIRKRMEAELAPKLKQELVEGLKTKAGPITNTLGNVRGDGERTNQKSDMPTRLDFRQVFPWGASRS